MLGALLLRRDMGVAVPLMLLLLLSGGPPPLGVREGPSGLGEELSWARGGAAMTLLGRTADEVDEDEDAGGSLRGLPPRKTWVGPLEEPAPPRLSGGLIGETMSRWLGRSKQTKQTTVTRH